MVLRDEAGLPLLVTDDPEEFVQAVDKARSDGQKVHWDDQDTLDLDALREQAQAQAASRAHMAELRELGRINEHGVVLPSEGDHDLASFEREAQAKAQASA